MIEIATSTIAAKAGFGAISAVFKSLTMAAIKKLKDRKTLQIPSTYDLTPISEWYTERITDSITHNEESIDQNLSEYLNSRQFTTFIQYIFVYIFSGKPIENAAELKLQLERGLDAYGFSNAEDTEVLYRILCSVSQKIYDLAKVEDLEIPQEASIEANAIISTALLTSIEEHLSRIAESGIPPVAEVSRSVNMYQRAVSTKFGKIQPQSFDGAPSFDINELYVVPTLSIKSGDHKETVEYHDMVAAYRKSVVVGDPGGGKTTISQKVACDLARGEIEIDGIKGKIIPFVIVLRDYGTYLKNKSGRIVDYIVETSASIYQVPLSEAFVESLLESGHLYIIFDGLDELLDTSYRKQIAETIELFSILYPSVSVLVTSRIVGYSHNALNEETFTKFTLGEFEDEQVSKYVHNWFRLMNTSNTADENKKLAEKFVEESNHARNIRSNPLMLGLMCTIYKTESYIPRNRPDVYEKCSRMLFKNWDKNRGIGNPVHFEAHIDGAVASLAADIYESPEMQSGVDERVLVNLSTKYFTNWAYSNENEARAAAQEFVGMCKGRAWILAEAGLSPDGETLFRFTHRTFLEYFTAYHIWQTIEGVDRLCEKLIPRIAAGELDVVAELSLQMAAKSTLGGADKVIKNLISAYSDPTYDDEKMVFISLAARSLSFLVLSPPAIQKFIPVIVRSVLNQSLIDIDNPNYDYTIMVEIAKSVRESREQIRESVVNTLVDLLNEGEIDAELICVVAWDLPSVFGAELTTWGKDKNHLPEDMQLLKSTFQAPLLENSVRWPWACMALVYEGVITPSEALEIHPTYVICREAEITYIPKRYMPAALFLAQQIIYDFSTQPNPHKPRFAVDETLKLFSDYVRSNFPFIIGPTDSSIDTWSIINHTLSTKFKTDISLQIPEGRLNDLALLIAVNYARVRRNRLSNVENRLYRLPPQLAALFKMLVLRESENNVDHPDGISRSIEDLITDPVVLSWSKSEINLIEHEAETDS